MTPPNGATPRDLASENEEVALRWAGPFGWAVLQVLRRSDVFAEADFADFVRRAPMPEVDPHSDPVGAPRAETARGRMLEQALAPSATVSTPSLEPAPPPEFYRRATRSDPSVGRAGEPPPPPGRRDASGRYVRPAR